LLHFQAGIHCPFIVARQVAEISERYLWRHAYPPLTLRHGLSVDVEATVLSAVSRQLSAFSS
jgi:hypothetical protein